MKTLGAAIISTVAFLMIVSVWGKNAPPGMDYDFKASDFSLSKSKLDLLPQSDGMSFPEKIHFLEKLTQKEPQNTRAWIQLGYAYFSSADMDKAFAAFKTSVTLDSKSDLAWDGLGVGYACKNEWSSAVDAFQKAFALNPRNSDAAAHLGYALDETGKQAEAEKLLRETVKADPLAFFAWNNLGRLLCRQLKYKEAIDVFNQVLQLNPEFIFALRNRGVAKFMMGNNEEAIQDLRKACEIDPKQSIVWITLAAAYTAAGQPDKSLEVVQQGLKANPDGAELWQSLGTLYDGREKTNEALEAFRKACELRPQLISSWRNLVNYHLKLKEAVKAAAVVQQAIDANPHEAELWFLQGSIYFDQTVPPKYKEALSAFQKATELNPKNPAAWRGVVNCYYRLGQRERSLDLIRQSMSAAQKGLEANPDNLDLLTELSTIYLDLSMLPEVEETLLKIQRISPEKPGLSAGFVALYTKTKQYEKAAPFVQRALEETPKNALVWYILGEFYIAKGMAKEAQQCLEKSCEIDRSSCRILTMLGILYNLNGESDKALKVLQDATLLDEKVDGTWEALASVYQGKRNYKEALEAHEKAISINPGFPLHWKGKATDLMCLGRIDESIVAIKEALRLAPDDSESQSTLQMLLVLQKKN